MEAEKFHYRIVSAFLIVSFITPPLFLAPHRASAQNYPISLPSNPALTPQSGAGYSFGSGIENASGIPSGPSDSGVENWKEKSCGALIGGAVKSLFGGKTQKTLNETVNNTTGSVNDGVNKNEAVPTFDTSANSKLSRIYEKTTSIQTDTTATNKKLNCWDSMAKIMMKIAIRQVTLSIIDWINHGYEGKPFFLENPAGFFKDIAKNEFLTFSAEIGNPALFPFGKNFLIGAIGGFKNKFEANARYSLDELIAKTNPGRTRIDFNANFNVGGWDAWLGMTAPQNNPIGFGIIASNELALRLEGTEQSKATQTQQYLLQTGGFLGDERCVNPHGVTHEDDAKARAGDKNYSRCEAWEYVTPGKLIAERITYSQNSPLQSLEMADDINSALAAIADTALNQFISNYSNKGLKALTASGNTESFNISSNFLPSDSGTQFPEFYVTPGSWISHHLDFKMQSDVNQAFVDEQRTYLSKMGSYNNSLNTLTKNIYQLDYCIPGPHPGWEEDSRRALSAAEDAIPAFTEEDMKGKNVKEVMNVVAGLAPLIGVAVGVAITAGAASAATGAAAGAAAGSVVPGLGTVIGAAVGVTVGLVAAYVASHPGSDKKLRMYYSGIVSSLTGLYIDFKEKPKNNKLANNLAGYTPAMGVLDTILDRYTDIAKKVYSDPHMPAVTQEAAEEFKKIPGYQQIVENNITEIAFRKGIITRLEALKVKIDDLNAQLASNANFAQDYEENFKPNSPIVTEFSRLSAYFVDGDDIANIDNLYKEAIDRTDYVYKDLLTGTYGCEQDLAAGDAVHLPWQIATVKRMPYPFGKLYDYNNYGSGALLPSGNHMPGGPVNVTGPGFLTPVHFASWSTDSCIDQTNDLKNPKTGMPFYLAKQDLIPEPDGAGCTLVGHHTCGELGCSGAFETTIGIY